jgi:hypothetical protein
MSLIKWPVNLRQELHDIGLAFVWRNQLEHNFTEITKIEGGRDGSVGIATHYGLDGPGIESRWGSEIFRTRPDPPWGPPSLLYNGVKRPGRGADHPPPSSVPKS